METRKQVEHVWDRSSTLVGGEVGGGLRYGLDQFNVPYKMHSHLPSV